MKDYPIHISIVMPTYNRCNSLRHVLSTLLEQNYPQNQYEIILADSGSSDGTHELMQELAAENLQYISGPNRGRAGARNRGIQAASGDIILFTDADILAHKNLLQEHARIHSSEKNIAMVGCEVQINSLAEYQQVLEHPETRRTTHRRAHRELPWYFYLPMVYLCVIAPVKPPHHLFIAYYCCDTTI